MLLLWLSQLEHLLWWLLYGHGLWWHSLLQRVGLLLLLHHAWLLLSHLRLPTWLRQLENLLAGHVLTMRGWGLANALNTWHLLTSWCHGHAAGHLLTWHLR